MSAAGAHIPRKRFGQHFLHDAQVISRIVAAIDPQPGQQLLEIGPGLGALTLPLLQAVGNLEVVELDRDLLEPLRQRCASLGNLQIYHADALRFDFNSTRPRRIVGNLPYNISTPLLFHLLNCAPSIHDLHFMLQQEVVERMAAAPGTTQYGRLSVMLQSRCQVQLLFKVGPGAFRPPPQVWSAVVRLQPYNNPKLALLDEKCFAEVVRRAFAQRRKTLRRSLQGLLDATQIAAIGIDPSERPQNLDLAAFASLANALAAINNV